MALQILVDAGWDVDAWLRCALSRLVLLAEALRTPHNGSKRALPGKGAPKWTLSRGEMQPPRRYPEGPTQCPCCR